MSDTEHPKPAATPDVEPRKRPSGPDEGRKHEVDQYERPPVDDPIPADPDA